jgi:acetyltransferase-like isoleucine patch superfamily enzyme
MNYFKKSVDTPWKAVFELRMLFLYPLTWLYLNILCGVKIQKGFKFYGFPKIYKFAGSEILIGKRFENRNWWDCNPLGINHPTIICTWSRSAKVAIGNDVGMSGGSIVSATKIEIGNGTLIGANTTIIDTDFHPIESSNRRYDLRNIRSRPISIGKNVFIGANCFILKGANIPDNSIVPAGSIVRSNTKLK